MVSRDPGHALNKIILQDGHVILPGVLPADQLESQRNAYEQIVARAHWHDATWYTTAAVQQPKNVFFR
ncbi:MAG: hypothetical protein CMM47_04995 [Rhodospirillaceae bacterium]|nr:hypothetical protein [Rhodospirillaceae bacterium]